MKVLPDKATVYFDVDDTLVMWGKKSALPVVINALGFTEKLKPHLGHIKRLKRHHNRGHVVVVWSQAGTEWAEAVVNALGLSEFVDLVVTKPAAYYDDIDCEHYMGKALYFPKEEEGDAND